MSPQHDKAMKSVADISRERHF